jgi:hypothetical protein
MGIERYQKGFTVTCDSCKSSNCMIDIRYQYCGGIGNSAIIDIICKCKKCGFQTMAEDQ